MAALNMSKSGMHTPISLASFNSDALHSILPNMANKADE